jgi:hypothetical protein
MSMRLKDTLIPDAVWTKAKKLKEDLAVLGADEVYTEEFFIRLDAAWRKQVLDCVQDMYDTNTRFSLEATIPPQQAAAEFNKLKLMLALKSHSLGELK